MQGESYGLDMNSFTKAYEQSLSANCDLDFRPNHMHLFMTYCLVTMTICAKLHSNPTMGDKVMARTLTGFTEAYEQSISADSDLGF